MIRFPIAILMLLALAVPAFAQPVVDEDTKVRALKRAYELNGNSMKGWTGDPDKGPVRWRGMIDLSQELVRADPVPSTTLDERTAEDERWVRLMEWVEICTTSKPWEGYSDAERLDACLIKEQQLRNQGRCMYSPGVIGIWNGKHCR